MTACEFCLLPLLLCSQVPVAPSPPTQGIPALPPSPWSLRLPGTPSYLGCWSHL